MINRNVYDLLLAMMSCVYCALVYTGSWDM